MKIDFVKLPSPKETDDFLRFLLLLGIMSIVGLTFLYFWKLAFSNTLTPMKVAFAYVMTPVVLALWFVPLINYDRGFLFFVVLIPSLQYTRLFIDTSISWMVPENALLILAILSLARLRGARAVGFTNSKQIIIQLAYLLLVFTSLLLVPNDRRWGLFYIGYVLPFVYLFVLRNSLLSNFNKLIYAIPLSVLIGCWPMIYFTLKVASNLGNITAAIYQMRGGISNEFVGWALLMLPLFIALIRVSKRRGVKKILMISIGIITICMCTSLSRGVVLLAPICFILYYWAGLISLRHLLILIVLIASFQFSFDYISLIRDRFVSFGPFTRDPRVFLISTYLEIIKESPFFGCGLGNFYGSIASTALSLVYNSPCHNLFTYVAAETGSISLVALLGSIFMFFYQGFKTVRRSKDQYAVLLSKACMAGMASFLIYAHVTGAVLVEENISMTSATGMYLFVSMIVLQEVIFYCASKKRLLFP